MADLKSLFNKLLRQSPNNSATQPQASSSTPETASRARRVTSQQFDPQAIVGELDTQPNLPELPTYQPHEKHGFLDRMIAGFKGGQRGGIGGFIEGARRPEIIEQQDWQRNELWPAMQQRQLLSREADQQTARKIQLGQLLNQLLTTKNTQVKNELDAAKPVTQGEFLMYRNPASGQIEPLMGPNGKPIRAASVASATINQEGNFKRQQEQNKGNLEREDARGKNNMAVEKERSGRARYTADTNAKSRLGAAQINAGARIQGARINAGSKTSKTAIPKFFDEDDIQDLANNEMKGKSPEEIRHALEMKNLKFKPKPQ